MTGKDKWINEVENSLTRLKPVEVNPYLYSKILNRLNSKPQYAPARLVWATVASMVVLVLLNIMVAENVQSSGKTNETDLQTLADQYQLTDNNLINYN